MTWVEIIPSFSLLCLLRFLCSYARNTFKSDSVPCVELKIQWENEKWGIRRQTIMVSYARLRLRDFLEWNELFTFVDFNCTKSLLECTLRINSCSKYRHKITKIKHLLSPNTSPPAMIHVRNSDCETWITLRSDDAGNQFKCYSGECSASSGIAWKFVRTETRKDLSRQLNHHHESVANVKENLHFYEKM